VLKKITYKNIDEALKPNINRLNKDFKTICYFNSNTEFNSKNHLSNDKLIAIGCTQEIIVKNENNALEQLQSFYNKNKFWIFGCLSYDLKNNIENLTSENLDMQGFPLLYFFVPKIVIQVLSGNHILYYDDKYTAADEAKNIYELTFLQSLATSEIYSKPKIKSRITKEEYLKTFDSIKTHIYRGDIYEINFCQEFYSDETSVDPVSTFEKLNEISQAPFAAFCKFGEHYLLSSSPERYLKKEGNHIISQPIKGTAKRSMNAKEDKLLKEQLQQNLKERNENVMIVDLVRNDLSRIAKKGSVQVDELFGVYSFRQVHQLISTVSCELKENTSFTDIIKNTFPMGSMTGAPKISAMQLIEKYENTRRGMYSGAIGYINPEGDFDFSVVIRSILYNSATKHLSFMVGSAITAGAEARQEYDECLLKAKAMFEVLE
jgi:para-aminobenzoate synthetase component I